MAEDTKAEHDDGGAAAEDAAAEAGLDIREDEGGGVTIALDAELAKLIGPEERSTRHAQDEHEEVPMHDASGRAYTEAEREELRKARREEKKRRRNAAREREDRLRATVDSQNRVIGELTQRLSAVEQKSVGTELQNLDNAIKEAKDLSAWYETQMKAAGEAKDVTAAVDYSSKMTEAKLRANHLDEVKREYVRRQSEARNAPPAVDPRHRSLADAWIAKNSWYNRDNPTDADSMVAMGIDTAFFRENKFNPATPEYWEELTKRMKKYLPHRFKDTDEDEEGDDLSDDKTKDGETTARRTPPPRTPNAGGGSTTDAAGRTVVRLSRARVEALKEAGMWNDIAKRNKMIKRYLEEDRKQRSDSQQRSR